MATTETYVDPAIAANTGSGTIGDPYGDLQHALNTITRNATDGDRINVKAGTAEILAATLSLSTYGTPSLTAPLIIQGYTSVANDGGIGEITGNAGNFCVYDKDSNSSKVCIYFIDLKIGNTGTAEVFDFAGNNFLLNCEIHTSSNANGVAASFSGPLRLVNCYFHDLTGADGVELAGTGSQVFGCFFDNVGTTNSLNVNVGGCSVVNNIFRLSGADTSVDAITVASAFALIVNNTIYSSVANTGRGINVNGNACAVLNNIVEGYSGAGGDGIEVGSTIFCHFGSNAIYNCTNAVTFGSAKLNWTSGANDTLGASPFTNKAGGDFSIPAATTGVTEDAFPSTWKGLTTTLNKSEKGAAQAGAGAGGGGSIFGGLVVR